VNQHARSAWARAARRRRCVMCGAPKPRGHHVITQQELRKLPGMHDPVHCEAVLWDRRNMLPLCDRCHARHHSRFAQVPLPLVLQHCPLIVAFAAEHGLTWYLSREHGSARPGRRWGATAK
jgi:hypothetical protein